MRSSQNCPARFLIVLTLLRLKTLKVSLCKILHRGQRHFEGDRLPQIASDIAAYRSGFWLRLTTPCAGRRSRSLVVWAVTDDLRARWSVDHTWKPQMEAARRQELYAFWKKAVTRSFDWL